MPSWKKVITSGSNAALNHITSSGNISGSSTSTGSFGLVNTTEKINLGSGGVSLEGSSAGTLTANVDNQTLFNILHSNGDGIGAYLTTTNMVNLGAKGSSKLGLGYNTGVTQQMVFNTDGDVGLGDEFDTRFIDRAKIFIESGGDVTINSDLIVTGSISGSSTSTGSFGRLETFGASTFSGSLVVSGTLKLPNISDLSASLAAAVAGGDNLGNHTATQNLVMGGNDITGLGALTSTGNISGSSTSTGSFGSVIASDLTEDRLTLVGANGQLTDSANFTLPSSNILKITGGSSPELQVVSTSVNAAITIDKKFSYRDAFLRFRQNGVDQWYLGTVDEDNYGDGDEFYIGTGTSARKFVINPDASADLLTMTGNLISGSATSTGSFGKLLGDGSDLTGINTDLSSDTTPQLGGDLDLNSSDITGTGNIDITGNITATGDVIAKNYIVSSSVTYMTQSFSSGSTIFGDTLDDTHRFTGSLLLTGSNLTIDSVGGVSGSATSTGSFGAGFIDNKLGIGETNPDTSLHLKGSAPALRLEGTVSNARDYDIKTDGNEIYIEGVGGSSGGLKVGENGVYNFTVDLGNGNTYTAGNAGIGIANAEGKLHVFTADASVAPHANADDLVIENSGHAGISLLSGNDDHGVIYFGDAQDNDVGIIEYDHDPNTMSFSANATKILTLTDTKISGSSTSTGSFGHGYIDNKLGIGTSSPVARLEVEDGGTSNPMLLKLTQDDTAVYGMVVGNDTFSTTETDGGQHILSNEGTYIIRTVGAGAATRFGAGISYSNYNYLEITGSIAEFTTTKISGSSTSTGSFGSGFFDGRVGINQKAPTADLHISSPSSQPGIRVDGAYANIQLEGDNLAHISLKDEGATSGERVYQIVSDGGILNFNRTNDAISSVTATPLKIKDDKVEVLNISGSATSTGSFGKLLGDGSSLTGISSDVVNDTSPQLGGNLDLNSNDITGTGNIDITGNITARNFIVSSSVTNIVYQALSGSTIFGDTSDDTHQFTGSIFVQSGSISQELHTVTNSDRMFFGRSTRGIPVSGSSNISRFATDSGGNTIDLGYTTVDGDGKTVLTAVGDGIHNDLTNYWYNNNFFRVGTSGELDGANFQGLNSQYVHYDLDSLRVKGDIIATTGSLQGEVFINSPSGSSMFIGKYTGGIPVSGSDNISRYATGSDGSIIDLGFTTIDGDGNSVLTTTGDGIYVDDNNYWYTTGHFKIGSSTNRFNWDTTSLSFTGPLTASGDLVPSTHNTYDLGADSYRWANIYTADLQLSNENATPNEIDGTTGSWTIQEGEDDLYLLNRKNGKKYRFKLEEIE